MKLLVFAHTPPPHHGQSYMVQLLLEGFGGDRRKQRKGGSPKPGADLGIECYHVNARVSKKLEEIGDFRPWKFFLLLYYCAQAIWCRFRYGIENFYYVPAPGKKSALYRDWVVMLLCRTFFKRLILHWHASGMGKWLEQVVQSRYRELTYYATRQADLSIVLSNYGRADAEKLYPLRVAIVGNGLPDPCPEFAREVLPRRRARLAARRAILSGKKPDSQPGAAGSKPNVFKVLFMGHCTREKGLFDAVRGAILAHEALVGSRSPISLKLIVAGQFMKPAEESEFRRLCASEGGEIVEYVGFLSGTKKREWLEEADCFCFPSHIESFGLVLAEAMAFGLPIVTARAGAVPEVMRPSYEGLVDVHSPEQIRDGLLRMIEADSFETLRERFETHFVLHQYVSRLAAALKAVEAEAPGRIAKPALVATGSGY